MLVSDVMPDTPAEKAGLKQGDVIVKLNGEQVNEVVPFRNKVALIAPGTQAVIAVIRDGRQVSLPVKIEKMPVSDQAASSRPGIPDTLDTLGLSVWPHQGPGGRHGFKGEKGILVTAVEPGSAAATAGIGPGMLIEEVNRTRVDDIGEFKKAVAGKKSVLLLVRDRGGARYVTVQMDESN